MRARKTFAAAAVAATTLGTVMAGATTAGAAACDKSTACLFYNSNYGGASFRDNKGNSKYPENYGAPNWYTFSGGAGNGVHVKNNAASVYNYDTTYSVYIYYNSNLSGPSQHFNPRTGGNLNSTLKNNNASQCFDFYTCP